jgi:hypothetical protein
MLWFLSIALTYALTADTAPSGSTPAVVVTLPSPQTMLAADNRRVRSSTDRMNKIIAEGVRRSPTFARLVIALHQTNVIVYVEPSFALPPEMAGRLLFSTIAGGQRYLRVQVLATLQGDQLISVIGHELTHALEVADDPAVVNQDTLAKLYRRIGDRGQAGPHTYDTEAARLTGRTVRAELVSYRIS